MTKPTYSLDQSGRDFIKSFEGCRLKAYLCSAGVPTIGYGHTGSNIKLGMTITQAQADAYFNLDIMRFEKTVREAVDEPLTQGQFNALVSFAFNVGVGAFLKSTMLKKLNVGDYKGAAGEFTKWNKAGGRVVDGLTRRRAAEKAMFLA